MSLNSNTETMEELLATANALPTSDEVYAQGYNAALALLADRIVEIGTEASTDSYTGDWYWKKYDSGEARCYGRFYFGSVACTSAWSGFYECTGMYKTFPADLFIDAPLHLDISLVSGSGAAFITQDKGSEMTAQQTGRFTLSRPSSMTLTDISLGFEVIGRWK